MLEDWAWRYVALSEVQVQLVSLGMMVLGGIAAALFHRGRLVLNRAQYFALNGVAILGVALGQAIWLLAPAAMRGGWLGGLALAELVISFAAGYALVALGQARSRHVYGHGKAGIVVLVPIANFWLLFAPGKAGTEAWPGVALVNGGLGVFSGLSLIVVSRLVLLPLLPAIEAGVIAAGADPALTGRFIEVRLAQLGPAAVLQEMAAQAGAPQDLGNGVSLAEVTASGTVLSYVYHMTDPAAELGDGYADTARGAICEDAVFLRLLDAGARVDFRYRQATASGSLAEIGAVTVASVDCGV